MERTLVLIKPDGVKRGLIGAIINRFEIAGLKVVGIKMVVPDEKFLEKHYPLDKEWYENAWKKSKESAEAKGQQINETPLEFGKRLQSNLINAMKGSPVVAIVIEGNEAISNVRKLIGSTSPSKADPSTIRGMYSTDSYDLADKNGRPTRNLVHASDSPQTAEREIKLWFNENEIKTYKRADEDAIY